MKKMKQILMIVCMALPLYQASRLAQAADDGLTTPESEMAYNSIEWHMTAHLKFSQPVSVVRSPDQYGQQHWQLQGWKPASKAASGFNLVTLSNSQNQVSYKVLWN